MQVNITTFAFNLSVFTRKTLEASTPFHTCYVEADATGKAQLRREWMLGHVAGTLYGAMGDNAMKLAERILSTGKGEGAKPQSVKAIDKASSDFRYHVIRPTAGVKETKAVRISAAEKAAYAAFVEACGGDVKRAAVVFKTMSAK